jgi:predicted secreted Zn-dependent protease
MTDEWRTSSFCGNGACVQVAVDGDAVQVRDSKDPGGPVLTFTRDEWRAFTRGMRAHEFDV